MLVRNESSTDTLVAMLASCSSVQLQVQLAGGGLEDAVASCSQKRPYYSSFEASGEDPGDEEIEDCTQQVEKKRRLTFDQVRSLEKNFEIENKLEPERKLQLAQELGLQPRQVAVWFQNRRARWKTKQLERDYEVLSLDYNQLKNKFDDVVQEKQQLQEEMDCLRGKLPTPQPSSVLGAKEQSKKLKTASQPSPPKMSEASVKLEQICTEHTASYDALVPFLEGDSSFESSDSMSSEIVNADSPRTSDSISLVPLNEFTTYPHIPTDSMVDSSIIHMSDSICDQMLSPIDCHRISVKLEDGSFQDESCNYMLSQLDEERGLPWWDWP